MSYVKKDKLLIIDTDSAIYACCFICEKKEHFAHVDGQVVYSNKDKREYNKWFKALTPEQQEAIEYSFTEELLPFTEAKIAINGWIKTLMDMASAGRKVVLLTKGGACFRTYLATLKKYKGNRDVMTKPKHYDELRMYLKTKVKALVYSKWEADDTARMVQVKASKKPDTLAIIANIDKDLEQIPSLHVNPNHNCKKWREAQAKLRGCKLSDMSNEGIYQITEEEGWYNFYIQMLMGDGADNIPGLKGVGKKTAQAMLADCHTPEEMCDRTYTEYVKFYGAQHKYTPWWWEDKYSEEPYLEDPIVLAQRKKYPKKTRTVPVWAVFRENADLLYMLASPDDQYVPHCEYLIKEMKPYPKGVVSQFLGD